MALYVPGAHSVISDDPGTAYDPGLVGTHAAWPVPDWKVPAAQLVQIAALPRENFPGKQLAHDVADAADAYRPGSHFVQPIAVAA